MILLCNRLSGTHVKAEGGLALVNGLKKNSTMLALNVWYSEIFESKITDQITALCKRNQRRYKHAWRRALVDNETPVQWRQAKLMVIGEKSSGKTSLINCLLGRPNAPAGPDSNLFSGTIQDEGASQLTKLTRSIRRNSRSSSNASDLSDGIRVRVSETLATNSRSWFSRAQMNDERRNKIALRRRSSARRGSTTNNRFVVKSFSFASEAAAQEAVRSIRDEDRAKYRELWESSSVDTTGSGLSTASKARVVPQSSRRQAISKLFGSQKIHKVPTRGSRQATLQPPSVTAMDIRQTQATPTTHSSTSGSSSKLSKLSALSFLSEQTPASDNKESGTAGTEFDPNMCIKAQMDRRRIKYAIFDYGGGNVFSTIHHLFLTENGIYLVVFNIKKLVARISSKKEIAKSLTILKFWLNSVRLHAPNSTILLVGTSLDTVSFHLKKKFLKTKRRDRVSKKDSDSNLSNLSKVSNATPSGLFIIRRKMLEDVSKLLEEELSLSKSFPSVIMNEKIGINFFPLSNKTHVGIEDIRQQIIRSTLNLHLLQEKIPIKWLKLLDYIYNNCYRSKKKNWVSLRSLKKVGRKFGIGVEDNRRGKYILKKLSRSRYPQPQAAATMGKSKSVANMEFERMLNWFNEAGVLLYFNHSESLRETIVVKPQWLLEKFTQVFSKISVLARPRPRQLISRQRQKKAAQGFSSSGVLGMSASQLEAGGRGSRGPENLTNFRLLKKDRRLLQEWEDLRKNGIVTRDLLEFLWGYSFPNTVGNLGRKSSYGFRNQQLGKQMNKLGGLKRAYSSGSYFSLDSDESDVEGQTRQPEKGSQVFSFKTRRRKAQERAVKEIEFLINLMKKLLLLNETDSRFTRVGSKHFSGTLTRSLFNRGGITSLNSEKSEPLLRQQRSIVSTTKSVASEAYELVTPKGGYFLVPSLITNYSHFFELEVLNDTNFHVTKFTPEEHVDFFVMFDFSESFFPLGFFERFLSMLIAYASSKSRTKKGFEKCLGNLDFQIHEDAETRVHPRTKAVTQVNPVTNFSFMFSKDLRIYIGQTCMQLYVKVVAVEDYDDGSELEMSANKEPLFYQLLETVMSMVRKIDDDFMSGGLKWNVKIGKSIDMNYKFEELVEFDSLEADERNRIIEQGREARGSFENNLQLNEFLQSL